eukprot:238008-Chlamydomonas_euryale.AAC.2
MPPSSARASSASDSRAAPASAPAPTTPAALPPPALPLPTPASGAQKASYRSLHSRIAASSSKYARQEDSSDASASSSAAADSAAVRASAAASPSPPSPYSPTYASSTSASRALKKLRWQHVCQQMRRRAARRGVAQRHLAAQCARQRQRVCERPRLGAVTAAAVAAVGRRRGSEQRVGHPARRARALPGTVSRREARRLEERPDQKPCLVRPHPCGQRVAAPPGLAALEAVAAVVRWIARRRCGWRRLAHERRCEPRAHGRVHAAALRVGILPAVLRSVDPAARQPRGQQCQQLVRQQRAVVLPQQRQVARHQLHLPPLQQPCEVQHQQLLAHPKGLLPRRRCAARVRPPAAAAGRRERLQQQRQVARKRRHAQRPRRQPRQALVRISVALRRPVHARFATARRLARHQPTVQVGDEAGQAVSHQQLLHLVQRVARGRRDSRLRAGRQRVKHCIKARRHGGQRAAAAWPLATQHHAERA